MRGFFFGDEQFELGKFLAKGSEEFGEEEGGDGGDGAEVERARLEGFSRGEFALSEVDFGEDALGVFGKEAACGGGLDAACVAVEERLAEFGFEEGNLLTESGLGEVELAGGFGERASVDDGEDGLELADFHD